MTMVEQANRQPEYGSLLFEGESGEDARLTTDAPACFGDLNLDQIVHSLTLGREQYDLKHYFYTPLTTVEAVGYRHEVIRDLSDPALRERVNAFASGMQQMRDQLSQANALHYARQRQFEVLGAIRRYREAVDALAQNLDESPLSSAGLTTFRNYLLAYVHGPEFTTLVTESTELEAALGAIRYCVHILGNKVTVTPYEDESDYSSEVEETFAKFRQGDVKSHLVSYRRYVEMNSVEASILELVAQLYPDTFRALDVFATQHADYVDAGIARFDRELQFYLTYMEHIAPLVAAGLRFCYPTVSDSKEVRGSEVFDLALALNLVSKQAPVVTNDFALTGSERVIVVTGANQGGKTTFSRTFGQLHYLAALGFPVPGGEASLFMFDQIFTHYEKEEDIHSLSGKLEDELVRIHDILDQATERSIIIMNEIFTSTTLEDAITLGTDVLRQIIDRDILAVCVTFVDELSSLSDTTVSMVAAVDPADPASRTFKLQQLPADGLAYAVAISQKYGLSYRQIRERIAS